MVTGTIGGGARIAHRLDGRAQFRGRVVAVEHGPVGDLAAEAQRLRPSAAANTRGAVEGGASSATPSSVT
nr:hypothetical protein GCM10025699_34630 [Microbacterium flavescens]